jgi:hypothetical protein
MSKDQRPGSHDPNIMRHEELAPGHDQVSAGDPELVDAVSVHFERHVGQTSKVLHEIHSPMIHLDVHVIEPATGRPHWVLYTTGCAERAMHPPAEATACSHAELFCLLPGGWHVDREHSHDERWYFPVRWLKSTGRLPHSYATWIWYGHTIPNGDPATPLAEGVPFTGVALVKPYCCAPEFATLSLGERLIHFLMMVPLLPAEMAFKLEHGMDALEERLDKVIDKVGFAGLMDPGRPDACARKKLFGLF